MLPSEAPVSSAPVSSLASRVLSILIGLTVGAIVAFAKSPAFAILGAAAYPIRLIFKFAKRATEVVFEQRKTDG